MGSEVKVPVLFDTSVYIDTLRDAGFATAFRPRYARDVPRTYFSSVVVEELLAGARTFLHCRQAAELYEPFERVRRIVTPSHLVWKEAGAIVATLGRKAPEFRGKLGRGLLNDILIALGGRSIGATVVTRNGDDFRLIRRFKEFALEVI
jgi:predicted nucleic acid-binding protein